MTNIDGVGSIGLAALFHSIGAEDYEIDACVQVLKTSYPDPGSYLMMMREARASLQKVRDEANTVDADTSPPKLIEHDGEVPEPAQVAGVLVPPIAQAAAQ